MKDENIYVNEEYEKAIKIDPISSSVLLLFDTKDGEVLYNTEGILSSISKDIAKEVEDFFNIKMEDFNVEIEIDSCFMPFEEDK